ncbi:MAG TPA: hypothetical protein VLM83_04125 [Anaerolineales bacterium]|nr:hypothetical protein [Anaerolineales bacterium]
MARVMRCILFFLDGVGLGSADPLVNPFAQQAMPALTALLGGRRFVVGSFDSGIQHSDNASWLALDACLGVPGLPQSATGQAALLTGINIPLLVNGHDGPKPSPAVSAQLKNGNLFSLLQKNGHSTALLNAFPPRYFHNIQSGYRLPGAIALAAIHAGLSLKSTRDLVEGQALSADFTGQGWNDQLHIPGIPQIIPYEAGVRMAELSTFYGFSIFEYWISDIAGHRQEMQTACNIISTLDEVISGLSHAWSDDEGLIIITSDHGNLEDLSTRRHTTNPVPLILIGASQLRQKFLDGVENENPGSAYDLTRVAPAIINFLG